MRSAKNFHPQREYVAARRFLVGGAIGAIASGQVVLSLVDFRIGQSSVAAQTSAAPAQVSIGAPAAAKLYTQPVIESPMDSGTDIRLGATVIESTTNPN